MLALSEEETDIVFEKLTKIKEIANKEEIELSKLLIVLVNSEILVDLS